jgi:hypothetical protein
MSTHYGRQALETLTNNAPDYEDIAEGGQRKYNHTDCPSGVDTKQRLYVKNLDGAYLWHCHNCNDSGYFRPKDRVTRIVATASGLPVKSRANLVRQYNSIPVAHNLADFRLEGQLWLAQYEFNDDSMLNTIGIKEDDNGVYLPIWHNTGVLAGVQQRQYSGKPKYRTDTEAPCSVLGGVVGMPLVVVEDLMSSYKLFFAGYSTVCLLGTKLSDHAALAIAKADRVVVWLDDDTAGHKAAINIYKEVSPYSKEYSAMFLDQPKEIPMSTLRTMEI